MIPRFAVHDYNPIVGLHPATLEEIEKERPKAGEILRHHQLAQHVAETVADVQDDVRMLLGERHQQRPGELGGAAERRQGDHTCPEATW